MKKLITFTVLFLCFATLANAQIVVQSTIASSRKVKKEAFVSYRGSIEETFVVSTLGRLGCTTVMTNGLQVHPNVWIGLGVGFSWQVANGEKMFPTADLVTMTDYAEYEYYHNRNSYTFWPSNDITSVERSTFRTIEPIGVLFYPEIRVNLINPQNAKAIPYLAGAAGYSFINWAAYSHLRVGVTFLTQKQTFGGSFFAGVSLNGNIYSQQWSLETTSNKTITMYNNKSGYGVFFNLGVSMEFGGKAGYKPRSQKK